MNLIGARIRHHRVRHNMTQIELGERLGLSNSAISHYECGITVPSIEDIARICEVFNIPISSIIDDVPDTILTEIKPLIKEDYGIDILKTYNHLSVEGQTLIKHLDRILSPRSNEILNVSISKINIKDDRASCSTKVFYSEYIKQLEKQIVELKNEIDTHVQTIKGLELKLKRA